MNVKRMKIFLHLRMNLKMILKNMSSLSLKKIHHCCMMICLMNLMNLMNNSCLMIWMEKNTVWMSLKEYRIFSAYY
jgi:hypothetical protein